MHPALALLPLLAPLALLVATAVAARQPGPHPTLALAATRAAAAFCLAAALLTAAAVAWLGPATSLLLGAGGLGIALHLDALSVTLFVLVAFVGAVVLEYSRNYLAGDPRHGAFLGGLALTLAAVLLLVLAGNLVALVAAWVGTSLALHRMLRFYPERPGAVLAARKKFIAARIGDGCLVAAAVLLYHAFDTADIAPILESARRAPAAGGVPVSAQAAALLVAVAAVFKCAQFPVHGWVTEVMETPTPVSALLHAGIINAGGFLVVRLAEVMLAAPGALALLAVVGGVTALVASLVMLAQTSIKGALAWSTIGQMGFMLFQCGLGAFSAAVLHLVAHSLYKSHAFLSAGSVQPDGGRGRAATLMRPATVLVALAASLGLFVAAAALLGVSPAEKPAIVALGAVLVAGLAHLVATPLADRARAVVVAGALAATGGLSLTYFLLQQGAASLLAPALPAPVAPGTATLWLVALLVLAFVALAAAQMLARGRRQPAALATLRVHAANGFYVNVLLDRLLGAHRVPAPLRHSEEIVR